MPLSTADLSRLPRLKARRRGRRAGGGRVTTAPRGRGARISRASCFRGVRSRNWIRSSTWTRGEVQYGAR